MNSETPPPPGEPADQPETRAYARRSRSLVTGVWLASLVLAASSWFAACTLTDRDEREAMLRAQRDTGNLARIIAEQTTRAIAGTDRILNYVAYDLHRLGGQSALLRDALRNATQDSGLLLQLAYADGKGDLVQTSVDDAPARVNLADREHFQVHKDGSVQGLFISRPVFGRASGKWSIQLSRKVTAHNGGPDGGPDGGFGGIIVASLDPFYFSRIFDDLDVGRQGIVAIFGQDGILRARSVMNETIIGQDVSESALFKASRASAQGFLRTVSTVDGVTRLSSFRRLDSYPLVVFAGFAEAEFLAETWARQRIYVAGASAATALLLAMALLVTWQSRAQGQAHAALDETADKLRASKARLRDIAETASDWFWEMDAALRVTDVSGAVSGASAGASDGSVLDPSRLLGRRCDEIALRQPGDEARWTEFRRSLDEHLPFRDVEFAVRGPDGAVRIWSMSGKPVLAEDGRFAGYRGSGADVTERRRAERSLADSEQRYRAMFAAVGQPIVVTDQTAVITGFNPAAEALFGYREGEVVGQNVTVLMPEAQAFGHDALFRGYRASGRAQPVGMIREVAIRHADGTIIPTEIALSSWRTGGAEQFIGVFRDVSKAKQIEADLRQARDSAEHANRMKSEFLATISHEIRTPMNGVLGTLLLLGGGELAAEERRLAGIARQSAESLLRLLDDILDFSKLEAGKIAIEEETCAPSRIAEAVVDVFKPKADEKGLALSCRMLPSVPDAVVTDPARLRQILFNLVGNAIKFTSAGHVAIRARRGPDLGGDLGGDRPDGRFLLEFEVEDTGIGIRPEALPHMFDRFTQADSSITRRYGGTGLGLAICKELCGLLGGDIDVVSAPGRGSLFRFSIACALGDPADLRLDGDGVDAIAPQPALPCLRVLAVDDNPVNRDIVRAILDRAGHSVVTANDGAEAVQIAGREPFDLVLMDIQMPGMDGLTATRLIRNLPAPVRHVPVIALTAHASGSSRPECEDAGMNGFVAKPIRPAALFEEIAAVLSEVLGDGVPNDGGEPAPAAQAADGLLDQEQLDSVRDALGPEVWRSALDGFVRTAGEHVGQIADALEAGEECQRAAHTLKGLAWNVGAKRLGDLALAVETASPGEARALVPDLRSTLAATIEILTVPS